MLKLQAILTDGSVAMEFTTDDPSEAEEMREEMLAFDCVAEFVVLDESGWVYSSPATRVGRKDVMKNGVYRIFFQGQTMGHGILVAKDGALWGGDLEPW
jgi:hypothetical protein